MRRGLVNLNAGTREIGGQCGLAPRVVKKIAVTALEYIASR